MKRIIEVKQRIQTVVVYEYYDEAEDKSEFREAIVDSMDRPIQAQYV